MQISRFSTGGYVIHKILLQRGKGRFSAWYDKTGKLLDAEQIFDSGQTRQVVENGPTWQRLAEVGGRFTKPNPEPAEVVPFRFGL